MGASMQCCELARAPGGGCSARCPPGGLVRETGGRFGLWTALAGLWTALAASPACPILRKEMDIGTRSNSLWAMIRLPLGL
jgi:hypothetical protein